MKKIENYLLLIIFAICFSYINVFAISSDDIHSREALLVNMNNDEVLFEKNTSDDAVPIASLTKLMTYAVVIDNVSDLENTKVIVPDGLVQEMKNKGASRADLIDGYEYTILDLLYGMMLPSGCDAAETLARYIGNGDSRIFVEMMNNKAQTIGMNNTYYVDSYGIGTATEDNISTEQDLYKLIKYVYNLPYFKKIISTEYYIINGNKDGIIDEDLVRNTNYLIGEYSGGEYYYPYSIGGKTGTLDVAGKCLLTIAQKGDFEVVAITLGVPGEYLSTYDYHLRDHELLFDYIFNENTENITIDIGPEFRSLEIGKKLKIDATTSSETLIKWTTSDESVATIDENGIVTGLSQGQAKITATTSTGNIAYSYISVGFYNGVHTKYSTGVKNDENGWDPIDYSIIKNKGFDYVIIRAGYGDSTIDRTFINNIKNAVDNNLNVGIWYEGYAENVDEARDEANNLVEILNNISDIKEKINLPIFYNLLYSDASDPNTIVDIVREFKRILNNNNYDVILEIGKTKLSAINSSDINDIDVSIIYRSLPPDFKTTMTTVNGDIIANIWNYKINAYLGNQIGTNASLSLMYMSYKKLETIHKEYIEENNIEENNPEDNYYEDNLVEETSNNLYQKNNNIISSTNSTNIESNTNDDKINNKEEPKKENSTIKEQKDNKTNKNEAKRTWSVIVIIIAGIGIIFIIKKIN